MKPIFALAAMLTWNLSAPLCHAQPPDAAPDLAAKSAPLDEPLVSINFEDVPVGDLVKIIADEGKVQVLVSEAAGRKKVRYISVKDRPAAQVLEKIAQAADLKLTKINARSFALDVNPPAAHRIPAAPSVTAQGKFEMAAKPYTLKFSLPDGLSFEIGVAANDSFDVAMSNEGRSFRLRGQNTMEIEAMKVSLYLEQWRIPQPRVEIAALYTQVSIAPNKQAIKIGGWSLNGKPTPEITIALSKSEAAK